jgi:signal transduction histidine kinase
VIGLLAAATFIIAIVHQSAATRPIGEGEVFVADAERALRTMAGVEDPDEAVRMARNDLGIEAVSLVGPDGTIIASTSGTLSGQTLTNPLFIYSSGEGRFAALATSVDQPIELDGVTEWPAESVLYQVLSPLPDGDGSLLLHYDVSELLSRRAQPGEVQELTLQLLALGAVFVTLGTAVGIGHARATRNHREISVESELLRRQAEELERVNSQLADARRRAERALALSEEKMRIRSEFVLMINHELRTPLTSVVTGAELLRSGQLTPREGRELIDSMVANGKRLNEMIDQILAVARIENQGMVSELVAVPMEEVCAAAGAVLVEAEERVAYEVRTDVRTLSLVLASLADNAITHGASEVEVLGITRPLIEGAHRIGTRPPTPVYFVVSDDGPGIDPEFLPRAFEKFEKNSNSPGTGIGLYMVQVMVEAMGGSIEVATSPRGTIFQIALPARVEQKEMAGT